MKIKLVKVNLFLLFSFLIISKSLLSQCTSCGPQLITNGGFETSSGSCNPSDIQLYTNQTPVQGWYGTQPVGSLNSTPDYYNPACAGTYTYSCQTGSGFTGIFVKNNAFSDCREYIQAQLSSPLIAGHTYCFSMTVRAKSNFSGTTVYGSDGIGAWFQSVGMININTMNGGNQNIGPGSAVNANPQIQNPNGNIIGTSCITVSGQFCAVGGENWIVIGNFKTDAGTTYSSGSPSFSYLLIDNVSLQESCSSTPLNVTISPPPAVCPGACTTLTSTATGGSGTYTYSWSPGGQITNTISVCPLVTTTYTLITSSASACSTPLTNTTTVTVNVGGSATLIITPSPAIICNPGSATLTVGGASTYTWSPATGLNTITGSVVVASPASSTNYTVTGSSGGCTGTNTTAVTVNSIPTLTVNSATICNGNSAVLTVAGANTYTWSPATGLSSTTGASVTANPTVTTTYTVTGASAAGCTATATSTVTVNPTPLITAGSATICPGTSTVLTATGANTYSWTPSSSLNSSIGSTVTANPTVTTTYTITGTSVAGCVGTGTATLTISGSIVPSVNNATICVGSSATLNASGGTTYTWSPATGLSATTGNSVNANPSVTTTYTITAASGACTGTTTVAVTVNPLPTVTVNSSSICIGGSAALNANGAATYSWSPGTSLSSTTGASVTATTTVTTVYTVTGTSGSGCTATAASTVTVNPAPIVSVNSASICTGDSTTLTATGATTYSWTPATGLSSTTAASVTANPTITTIYTVTGTSAAGCTSTATSTVTVNTIPIVTVNSATVCAGGFTTLTANGAATYSWSPPTGLTATTGSNVIANPAVTSTYTVVGTTSSCTNSATAVVTITPIPVANAGPDKTICNGGSAVLTGSGGGNYLWSTGSSNQSITVSPVTTTKYILTVSNNNCFNKDTVLVIVKTPAVVTISKSDISCYGLSNGTASVSISGGTQPYIYNWQPGNINNTSIGSLGIGTYTFTVIDSAGCMVTKTISISQPSLLQASLNGNNNLCSGDNTTLSANATGGTPPYNYSWTGSAVNTSTLNVSPASTSGYTVIVNDSKGCSSNASHTVTVNSTPVASFTGSDTSCVPVTVQFTNSSQYAGTYLWVFGNGQTSTATNPSQVFSNPGLYSVTLYAISSSGCKDSITKNNIVEAIAQPANGISALSPTIDDFSPTATFTFFSQNSISCHVDFGDGSVTNSCSGNSIDHTYKDTGKYCATITSVNALGCKKISEACVYVEPSFTFYIPNSFTPDGDGVNETFTGYGTNFFDFKMFIYDRWGNKIYETNDYSKPWDGRVKASGDMAQIDVYAYKIELKDVKGTSHSYAGSINLIK